MKKSKDDSKDGFYIMLPNVTRYPYPPKDQPGCIVTECPRCKQRCWISAKKRFLQSGGAQALCYDCFVERAQTGEFEFGGMKKI